MLALFVSSPQEPFHGLKVSERAYYFQSLSRDEDILSFLCYADPYCYGFDRDGRLFTKAPLEQAPAEHVIQVRK